MKVYYKGNHLRLGKNSLKIPKMVRSRKWEEDRQCNDQGKRTKMTHSDLQSITQKTKDQQH